MKHQSLYLKMFLWIINKLIFKLKPGSLKVYPGLPVCILLRNV